MMSVAVTGHVAEWIKQELHALKQIDRRYTESRIVEESLTEYLPKLRARLRPDQSHSTVAKSGPFIHSEVVMITFPQLCAAYLAFLGSKSSYRHQVRLYKQYFSNWSDHPSRPVIRDWHLSLSQTPVHANRGLAFLKSAYNYAINTGKWTSENPASGIRRHKTYSRERVIVGYELTTLIRSLDFASSKFAAFLTVLLTTGCRMGEARKMAWEHVDLVNGCWFKPTTKNGKPQRIPLPRQACQALRRLPKVSAYMFPGHYGQPWSGAGVEKAWGLFRKILRLDDVTLHDFRRTVASRLYAQERDLMLVKACLNHYDGSATAVYVRLQYDQLAQALQRHADSLFGEEGGPAVEHIAPITTSPTPRADGPTRPIGSSKIPARSIVRAVMRIGAAR